jgi:hypothetical protein
MLSRVLVSSPAAFHHSHVPCSHLVEVSDEGVDERLCDHAQDDDQPFDYQGPLAEVEHVTQEFTAFLHMHEKIQDADVHMLNFRWSRCAFLGEERSHQHMI